MRKYTYISLFSSAGVGCYGFTKKGFDCIATNELIESRLEIQKANSKCKYNEGYIAGDITQTETKEKLFKVLANYKQLEDISDVDIIVATPPCQGMSTANYKKKNEINRNSLVVEAVHITKKIKPNIFVFENVQSFLKTMCIDFDEDHISIEEVINKHLGLSYNIYSKVVNFKDFGVPSSRPRTLVIGTKKELINISPLNLFPEIVNQVSIYDVIADLPKLEFGEISKNDVYHFFREYPSYMREWISSIKEGESAFDSHNPVQPYKLVDGKKQELKGSYMGNKFKRLVWNSPAACIATRNDQLASQSTIHPSEDRVLSIRELMRLMTIPNSFKWSNVDIDSLKTEHDKKRYLKSHELNIRRSIGEAVPTHVFESIAEKAKQLLDFQEFTKKKSLKTTNQTISI
ncbi:MAG: DNA cytosine methyltransferase [Firmicutes bacterium]|nr:DNA cytosine methyltransferase [Bacillota bacterium]